MWQELFWQTNNVIAIISSFQQNCITLPHTIWKHGCLLVDKNASLQTRQTLIKLQLYFWLVFHYGVFYILVLFDLFYERQWLIGRN